MVGNENDVKPDIIAGRNPVSEAIRSSRPIDKILVARGEKSGAAATMTSAPNACSGRVTALCS